MTKPKRLQKLNSFMRAAAKFAAAGFTKSSREVYDSRVLKCLACISYDVKNDECNECGCRIDIKASWSTERCPKDRWIR